MKKWLFLFIILCISGCGYKMGSMPVGGISTIAILPVQNKTDKTFIDESLISRRLAQEFHKEGNVKVVDSPLADALLYVQIINYIQTAETFSSQDVGSDFRLIVIADVKVIRKETEELLFHRQIEGDTVYKTGLDQSEIERITLTNAINDLAIDIVGSVVEGGW